MHNPISPSPSRGAGGELPAYLSNGVVGLRVRENPLTSGMSLVCGFTGEHAIRRVEAAAVAPYPLAADLRLNGVWLSDAPHQATIGVQAYDFSCAELSSELKFDVGDTRARLDWKTPLADCGNGKTDCMDYNQWQQAWTEIKG